MRRSAFAIQLTEEEKGILSEWLRRGKTERLLVERAKIVLLAHEGNFAATIAVFGANAQGESRIWQSRDAPEKDEETAGLPAPTR